MLKTNMLTIQREGDKEILRGENDRKEKGARNKDNQQERENEEGEKIEREG